MTPEDIEKAVFVTDGGLYEYLVILFKLINAPASFERLTEGVFRGLQWMHCLVYLNDIIIFVSDFKQTLNNLGAVLDCLRDAGLTCKPKKCELFWKKVAFLGHIVSSEELSVTQLNLKCCFVGNFPKSQEIVKLSRTY